MEYDVNIACRFGLRSTIHMAYIADKAIVATNTSEQINYMFWIFRIAQSCDSDIIRRQQTPNATVTINTLRLQDYSVPPMLRSKRRLWLNGTEFEKRLTAKGGSKVARIDRRGITMFFFWDIVDPDGPPRQIISENVGDTVAIGNHLLSSQVFLTK